MCIFSDSVAVFDSGIGGLTVLAACKKRMPDRVFYYFGDNDNAPYGNLPTERIRTLVGAAFEKINELSPVAAVVGCNTATAICAETLRKRFSFPIVGAEPAVSLGAKQGGEVFVLATRATCQSERFRALCTRVSYLYPQARILPYACDRLAGAIERAPFVPPEDIEKYLPSGNPDRVVLGCTHYVYWKNAIRSFYKCDVLDGNEGIARRLFQVLTSSEIKKQGTLSTHNHTRPRLDFLLAEGVVLDAFSAPIFFFGSQKNYNANVFEQMFAF